MGVEAIGSQLTYISTCLAHSDAYNHHTATIVSYVPWWLILAAIVPFQTQLTIRSVTTQKRQVLQRW